MVCIVGGPDIGMTSTVLVVARILAMLSPVSLAWSSLQLSGKVKNRAVRVDLNGWGQKVILGTLLVS